jgi:tRNA A37 methylthiotransferase MiaB
MKFYIKTYGCQMNVLDSDLVRQRLLEAGFIEKRQR